MPLYEYQCARCGRFEKIQKFSDPPLLACPTCGGEIQKVLSAPAIQFKGTGWYITDYARKSTGKGGESKSGEGSKPASGGKDGGSTDAAAKTDTTKAASGGSGSKGSTGGSTS